MVDDVVVDVLLLIFAEWTGECLDLELSLLSNWMLNVLLGLTLIGLGHLIRWVGVLDWHLGHVLLKTRWIALGKERIVGRWIFVCTVTSLSL